MLRSDWLHLLFTLGQVPLIALLMFVAYHKAFEDNSSYDRFARRFYVFGQSLSDYEDRRDSGMAEGGFGAERAWKDAGKKEGELLSLISEATARQRASIIFTLVVAAVWFGIMGACKEIVTEQHIIQRECRSCLRLGAYVISKMWVQTILIALQTALLALLVVPLMLNLPLISGLLMWFVLWMAGITAAALGLLISALARTYRVALTAVPVLMIPQLLFGGLLRPIAATSGVTHWPQILSYATIQRWAFEAGLSVDIYARQNVLQQHIDLSTAGRYAQFKIIQFQNGTLLGSFFGDQAGNHMVLPVLVLGCGLAVLLVACRLVLQRRFVS